MAYRLPMLRHSLRGAIQSTTARSISRWGALERAPAFVGGARAVTGQAWPAPPSPPAVGGASAAAAGIFSDAPSSATPPPPASARVPSAPPSAAAAKAAPPSPPSAAAAASTSSKSAASPPPPARAGLSSGASTSTPSQTEEPPKRPPTAWLRFLADYRKQHDTGSVANAMKDASGKWKALSKEEKAPYIEEYEAEKKLYQEKMAELNPGKKVKAKAPKEPKEGKAKKTKKATKDPEKPKRPLSAYLRFSQEVRPTLTDVPGAQKIKVLGERWKALPKAEQQKYEPTKEEKDAYQAAMKLYKSSGKEAAFKASLAN